MSNANRAADVVLHTDGASRGNPGPAGIGVVVERPTGVVVQRIAQPLGRRTNNQAEYEAVLAGLRAARELKARRVLLILDSELVARQLRGEYKVRDSGLMPLHAQARALIAHFEQVQVRNVPRGHNSAADKLANRGIENGASPRPRA